MVKCWNVRCIDEDKVYKIEEKSKIFTCPINNTHVIDRTSITEDVLYKQNEVIVSTESRILGGYLGVDCVTATIGHSLFGPTTAVITKTWPFDVALISAEVIPGANATGDNMDVFVNKNQIVGVIVAAVTPGQTTFTVSDTVLLYIDKGFMFSITDGVNTDDLGYVIATNYVTNTITTTIAATNSFAIGSFARMTIHMIRNVYMLADHPISAGKTNTNTSYVPANVATMQVEYTNNSTLEDKQLVIYVEMYY